MTIKRRTSARARSLLQALAHVEKAPPLPLIAPPEPSELHVRTRFEVKTDGDGTASRTVFCRRRGGSVSVSACVGCTHALFTPHGPPRADDIVRCAADERVVHQRDAAEVAMRTYVGEVTRRQVTCVPVDATWDVLEGLLLDQDNEALIVVDSHARPVGVVAPTDLLRFLRNESPAEPEVGAAPLEPGFHVEPQHGVARDIMAPVSQMIYETSPLSLAISVLGQPGVKQAPVLAVDESVVGVISASDVTLWVASQFGYE